ncbi:YeaC family protein [Aliivibrio sifiae]|uniref:Transcriptional regulator n=1 Tax=Aliivibrio sifiae TaxID=566293 RepID=A0A2S7XKI3_9GAMM|nr:DUF1315 family protein [Aliivibrio sifiae]PQJ93892.1 hypothetical protein BTO23_07335 [Aliivibrio sifiae]GLR75330.1 transcriptional regulator [Aliivibrio sifiae]
MDINKLLESMTPEVFENLQYAVETGKWHNGTSLSTEQRSTCMQAVMLYQSKYNKEAQHMTVAEGGEISFKSKAELKKQFVQGQEDIVRVNVSSD